MDEDRVELLRRLFVAMTELIEDASEIALQAQGHYKRGTRYSQAAAQLAHQAEDLLTLAQAAGALARQK